VIIIAFEPFIIFFECCIIPPGLPEFGKMKVRIEHIGQALNGIIPLVFSPGKNRFSANAHKIIQVSNESFHGALLSGLPLPAM
jgi:hypothetical protein